jgi:CRP/FNR family transcriptional regulator, cyclic AMP receptor protein
MSDGAIIDFLATVPLLEGGDEAGLMEFAAVVRRRRFRDGEVLWSWGDEPRDMAFIVEGALAATVRVPGHDELEISRSGPGEMLGALSLLDGRAHTMRVRATEPTTVLLVSRMDLETLLARRVPSAFRLKRRLTSLLVASKRGQLQQLAASLSGDASEAGDETQAVAELEQCGPPDPKYLRRMATFHDFDSLALWGFLTSGSYVRCPPGRTLLAEGAPSTACYLTINGAVETLLVRGERRIRIRLAGPGKAFGYESLIDGQPCPFTAVTRERAILLVLQRDPFDQLFNGEDAVSRVFLDVIQRDLVATLRQSLRPHAHLAASV